MGHPRHLGSTAYAWEATDDGVSVQRPILASEWLGVFFLACWALLQAVVAAQAWGEPEVVAGDLAWGLGTLLVGGLLLLRVMVRAGEWRLSPTAFTESRWWGRRRTVARPRVVLRRLPAQPPALESLILARGASMHVPPNTMFGMRYWWHILEVAEAQGDPIRVLALRSADEDTLAPLAAALEAAGLAPERLEAGEDQPQAPSSAPL